MDSIQFRRQEIRGAGDDEIDQALPCSEDTSVSILTAACSASSTRLEAGGDSEMLKDGETVKLTQSAVVLKLIGPVPVQQGGEGGAKK